MKRSHALDDRQRIERIKEHRRTIDYWQLVQAFGYGDDELRDDIRDLEAWINVLNGACRGLKRK